VGVQAWITLAIVAAMFAAMVRGLATPPVAALAAVVLLLCAGVLEPEQAFAGFANPAPITVAALYVLARAVDASGALVPIERVALGDGSRRSHGLLRLLGPAAAASAFLNNTPIVARVTDVTSTSFDVYLQNPSDGGVSAENVSYLVVEEGTWTVDGVNIEAQTYLSTVTDENNSWVGEAQSYGQSYTNPVVVGQVMSDNDPLWSVFWCRGTARANPPSAGALVTGKTVCEDTVVARANETVGFIVFEAGYGTIGGVEFEALLGADTIQGVTNSPPYTYTFSTAFSSAPTVAVTTMAGVDGGNGGWSYTYGASPATATTLDLVIDEDQISDSERNHITEQVGYVVFGAPIVYP